MTQQLSSAAQAVLNKAFSAYDEEALYVSPAEKHAGMVAAAALRAAADQVVPDQGDIWTRDLRGDAWVRWEERKLIRRDFLAIADELEAQ